MMDLFPTLLEMASIKPPEVTLDGEDIKEFLFEQTPQKDRLVYLGNPRGCPGWGFPVGLPGTEQTLRSPCQGPTETGKPRK